jgi:hypothetical protein
MSTISVSKVKKIINFDYPDFQIKSIKPLKGGWDNFVFEVNKLYIFRFPKKEDFNLIKEIRILNHLKGKTTLKIPEYYFIGTKFKYVGYKKIIGEPVTNKLLKTLTKTEKNILAKDIARFFYEFHESLPFNLVSQFKLKKNTEAWRPIVIKKFLIPKLKDQRLLYFVKLSLKKYLTTRQDKASLRITFSDLHGENMAYDLKKRRLAGIFDFSDVAIETLDREFSHLFSAEYELNLNIIKYYQRLSSRLVSLENVWLNSIIGEASIMAAYHKKPKSEIYQKAKTNLLRLQTFKIN